LTNQFSCIQSKETSIAKGEMVPTATMTSKGQIAVPIEVRRSLGLEPGDRVQFVELPDGSYQLRPVTLPVTVLKGFFGPWQGPAISIEDMNEAMSQAAAKANT
jgi:AbrB family looped-hinge helix DNA binding protein